MTMLGETIEPTTDAPAELVTRASDLVGLLRENATRTDRERRVAAENLAAVRDAGLFRLTAPRRWGGHEAGFETKIRVVSELARGCGSTSWVVALLTGGSWFVGMMNEQAQREVWSNGPDTTVAVAVPPSGTAKIIDDGYRISGRWPYCSGVEHADWVLLGARFSGLDGQPSTGGGAGAARPSRNRRHLACNWYARYRVQHRGHRWSLRAVPPDDLP